MTVVSSFIDSIYQDMLIDPMKESNLINRPKIFSCLLLAWIILIMHYQTCRYCNKMLRLPSTNKICNVKSIWWTTNSRKWLKPKLNHKIHTCWCPSRSLLMEKMTKTFYFSTLTTTICKISFCYMSQLSSMICNYQHHEQNKAFSLRNWLQTCLEPFSGHANSCSMLLVQVSFKPFAVLSVLWF